MNYLCISVRLLDDRYHGKDGGGAQEWPPSPFRLFQALLAGAFHRYGEDDSFLSSFRWLQSQEKAPEIVAPRAQFGQPFTRFVPNNDADKQLDRQKRLTAKTVRPTFLLDSLPISYLWELGIEHKAETYNFAGKICEIAGSIVTFGWGVDMAIGIGSIISEERAKSLSGERWLPNKECQGILRRVPCISSLDALIARFKLFTSRLEIIDESQYTKEFPKGSFTDLPPLHKSAFDEVGYLRVFEPTRPPLEAFKLSKHNSGRSRSFDTVRRGTSVAAMLRHVASSPKITTRLRLSQTQVKELILGHGEEIGDKHRPVVGARLAFIPLPSITPRGKYGSEVIGNVRHVLLVGHRGFSRDTLVDLAQKLDVQDLIDEGTKEAVASLSRLPKDEAVIRQYTKEATTWATVTPVILPGYDDARKYRRRLFPKENQGAPQLESEKQEQLLGKLDARTELLLRKAIRQAGYSEELAKNAKLDWRDSGFWPGTDLASRYAVPEKLRRFRRLHVRITWRDDQGNPLTIPGPLCLGSGRFIGLGLFAPKP